MRRIINIAFFEKNNKIINIMEMEKIFDNAIKNNLFYMKEIIYDDSILDIFTEYEMTDKEYELLFNIYNNSDGIKLLIDNKLEFDNIKYNIITL